MPALSNAKHERFAQTLAKGETADAAYISAGFSANRSNAARLNANELVRARVSEILERSASRAELSIARVLTELAKIGMSNMLDYVTVGSDGDPFVDLGALTRDQAAAIQEITVEDFKDGRGEGARDVRRVKFKLADKRAALVDIGRHLGMFTERVELTGRDGAPIQSEGTLNVAGLTNAQLRALASIPVQTD